MINIKKEFSLLKGTENILNLSSAEMQSGFVPYGIKKSFEFIKAETKIVHFGKDTILKLLDIQKGNKSLFIMMTLPNYLLPVTYNQKTNQIIINISAFGSEDVTPTNPDPRNLYSCFVYGYTFYNVIKGTLDMGKKIAPSIISYLVSMFIRLFGKDYGLLSSYAHEIPKLKFLLSCYILSSFFGDPKEELYNHAAPMATFDYRPIESDLNQFDFSKIEDFISSLSKLKVMPDINTYVFAKKFYTFFGVGFLPALEDVSRFIATLSTATVHGTTIVPTFISSKYNQTEFNNVIKISKKLFK
jgi:hypothetical protein